VLVKVQSAGQRLSRLRANGRWYFVVVLWRPVLEQPPERVLERRGLCLEPGAVAVGLVVAPGGEEVVGDCKPGLPEGFLFGHALAVGDEVAEQVRPAQLPLAGVEVVVAAPAVRADDPGEALAEQRPGLEGVAAGRDPEDRGPAAQGAPERAAAAGGLPAGLVDVDHRGRLDLLLEPGVRAGERLPGPLDDRVHRPGR
jgi:hypothetical protein